MVVVLAAGRLVLRPVFRFIGSTASREMFLAFVLLVIILVVVIRKTAVKDFFSNRREEIQKKFEELKAEKEASEKRYTELAKELEAFQNELVKGAAEAIGGFAGLDPTSEEVLSTAIDLVSAHFDSE